ncbi:MAG TPA: hypothetical protein VM537_32005, partial [Anaerolineae bacterium]|nr:hypothetical protein [Anaerolineae bacterium]
HIYWAIKGQSKSLSCDCRGGFAGTTVPDQGEGWPEVSKAELMDYGESDGEYISRGYMIQARGSRLDQRQAQAMADFINNRGKWEALREAADKALNRLANWLGSYDARIEHADLFDALAALKGDKS